VLLPQTAPAEGVMQNGVAAHLNGAGDHHPQERDPWNVSEAELPGEENQVAEIPETEVALDEKVGAAERMVCSEEPEKAEVARENDPRYGDFFKSAQIDRSSIVQVVLDLGTHRIGGAGLDKHGKEIIKFNNIPSIVGQIDTGKKNKDGPIYQYCFGFDALDTEGKIKNMTVHRPIIEGIAEEEAPTRELLRFALEQVQGVKYKGWLRMKHKPTFIVPEVLLISVPYGIKNERQRKVMEKLAFDLGIKRIEFMLQTMAALKGAGEDITQNIAIAAVDSGGGTTQVTITCGGECSDGDTINVAGTKVTKDIQEYISREHYIDILPKTAEEIKIAVSEGMNYGRVEVDLEWRDPKEQGKGLVYFPGSKSAEMGVNPRCVVAMEEIMKILDKDAEEMTIMIHRTIMMLKKRNLAMLEDVFARGIFLSGGNSKLKAFRVRLAKMLAGTNTRIICEGDAQELVLIGLIKALQEPFTLEVARFDSSKRPWLHKLSKYGEPIKPGDTKR
jgi:actin-like ATPase involved in cell morphogenesis